LKPEKSDAMNSFKVEPQRLDNLIVKSSNVNKNAFEAIKLNNS
jgi:hypothetical protein